MARFRFRTGASARLSCVSESSYRWASKSFLIGRELAVSLSECGKSKERTPATSLAAAARRHLRWESYHPVSARPGNVLRSANPRAERLLVETMRPDYRHIDMNQRRSVLVLLVLAAAGTSYAYSAVISIMDLTTKSEVVLLARVTIIRESRTAHGSEKRASAEVLEVWKGAATGRVEYIVSPVGWFACDTSYGRIGETIVLFLERDKERDVYRISHFGRGRMPVLTVGNEPHASIYEVTFAKDVVARQPRYPFLFTVPVLKLKAVVTSFGSQPAA